MIDAEAMEHRGVKVMNVHGIHRNVVAKLVGFAVTEAGLHAASGHPDRITPAVMVAAVVVLFNFALAIGGPSEFTAPNDQRVVQQAALLEVLHQRRAGLVGVPGLFFNAFGQVAVLVPPAMVELNKTHAALGHAT